MTARKITLLLIVTLLVAVSAAVMRAQSSEGIADADRQATQGGLLDVLDRIKQAQAQQLEGAGHTLRTSTPRRRKPSATA